jgi:hypothetical protein
VTRLLQSFAAFTLMIGLLTACGGGNGKVPDKAASDASSASSDSKSSSPASSADPSDPCSLLSQSDAEKAIGSKLKDAPKDEVDTRIDGTHGCRYATSDPSRSFAIEVYDDAKRGKGFATGDSGTPLAGVGDAARYDKEFHRVFVTAGDVAFAVVFIIGDLDDEQEAGTKIATAVVENL